MTDEEFEAKKKECLTKELLFHRYLYYEMDEPVATDSTYDRMERGAKEAKIPYFMDKTGMVGYNKDNPYHDEIKTFLKRLKPDLHLIQAYCWRELWLEQWDWHKERLKEYRA